MARCVFGPTVEKQCTPTRYADCMQCERPRADPLYVLERFANAVEDEDLDKHDQIIELIDGLRSIITQ